MGFLTTILVIFVKVFLLEQLRISWGSKYLYTFPGRFQPLFPGKTRTLNVENKCGYEMYKRYIRLIDDDTAYQSIVLPYCNTVTLISSAEGGKNRVLEVGVWGCSDRQNLKRVFRGVFVIIVVSRIELIGPYSSIRANKSGAILNMYTRNTFNHML